MAIGNTTRDFGNLPMSCVLPIGDATPQPLQGGKEYTDSQGNISAPIMVALGDTWKPTYSVGFTLVVVAGDAVTITCVSKVIKIARIKLSGTSTAATGAAVDISLIKRSTLDTSGTSTTPTIVPLDSANPVITAVVRAYTAAPTLGSAVGTMRVDKYVPTLATATATDFPAVNYLEYMWGNRPSQGPVLRTSTEQLCINFSATPLATNSFDFDIEWTEE